jgi:hypothetical protein
VKLKARETLDQGQNTYLMDLAQNRTGFSEQHHALLFALIAKEIVEQARKDAGEAVLRVAVRRYGKQRGRRMAMRALANGDDLSMTSFLIYGEWRSGTGLGKHDQTVLGSDVRMVVPRCPWTLTWMEASLSEYGRLYCLEIDKALVHGFNPHLLIDVNKTQTNDGEPCDFLFHQAALLSGDTLAYIRDKSAVLASKTVMPWDYHCGHLYKTFYEIITQELGDASQEAVRAALDEFAARFGEEAAQVVLAYQETDFDQLLGIDSRTDANRNTSNS